MADQHGIKPLDTVQPALDEHTRLRPDKATGTCVRPQS